MIVFSSKWTGMNQHDEKLRHPFAWMVHIQQQFEQIAQEKKKNVDRQESSASFTVFTIIDLIYRHFIL